MKWKGKLINYIIEQLKNDSKWANTIEKILIDSSVGIHLAVFNEPFLSLVFNGKKKIESRFSRNKIGPFEKIKKGDVVILKESGGPITGIFVAGEVTFFQKLNKPVMRQIEKEYGELICSAYDENFWESRDMANYASLIQVKKVKKVPAFKSEKKDRTAWVVLRQGVPSSLFNPINMDLKTIITISGRISSGKSYAANLVKDKFGIPIASFGDYLKYYCQQNNLGTDRKTLQDVGEVFIKQDSKQFLANVISHFIGDADTVILEGIRHKVIFDQVKHLADTHVSIFMDADLETRYNRYYARNKDSDEVKTLDQFILSDNHIVEQEIASLKSKCAIVINSTKAYSAELFSFLHEKIKI